MRSVRVLWLLAIGTASCADPTSQDAAKSSATEERAPLRMRSEPIQPLPRTDDLRASVVELGRKLFHDKRLSSTGEIACASCHVLAAGGADKVAKSKGVEGHEGSVNALTVLNSGFNSVLFWDGRAANLEEQVGGPLTNPDEMGASWDSALAAIRHEPTYVDAFGREFPDGINEANVRKALATYERALVTPSRFDKWLMGDSTAITEDERRGYETFKSVGCIACHQGRNAGGNMFQRFGVMGDYFKDRGDVGPADFGRYNVTKLESDKFVFRVPSLRNVEHTAPYFHDGTRKTLPEAIRTMARYQLGRQIPDEDVALIEKFLKSLSGEVPSGLGDPEGEKH